MENIQETLFIPILENMNKDKNLELLDKLINESLDLLYQNDMYLIEIEAHERSIVFRFSHYLQNLLNENEFLSEYNLDVEYNKSLEKPKRTENKSNGSCPDLIIHKRGSIFNNLLVAEFKTEWNRKQEEDRIKINDYININGDYRYKYGLLVLISKDRDNVGIEWRTYN